MLSHGLFLLLILSAVSTASPISRVRRSSLIPTPPPACIGKTSNSSAVYNSSNSTIIDSSAISNVTAGADNANLTDSTSISNVTSGVNTTTTTTCLIPASQLPTDLNSTDLSNMNSIYNCTDTSNSTTLSNSTDTPDLSSSSNTTDTSGLTPPDNSTTLSNSTDTPDLSSSSNTTDTSGLTPPDNSTSTDTTNDSTVDSTDDSTNAPPDDSTSDSTSDPTVDPTVNSTNTDSSSSNSSTTDTSGASDPPSDTLPPDTTSSGSDSGSSGIPDPTTGEFTANTTDPAGRRRRSLSAKWLSSWALGRSNYRRIVQADLPAVAQNWQDLCLDSGGDIFTNQPCVDLAGLSGINALLSTGGVCDQQDVADKMIDFAKSPGITNGDALVAAAIAYRQHPRNVDNIDGIIPSTPYCTKAPRNSELKGIVNEQLPGVEPGLYGGPNDPIVAFGEDGTCPAGMTPDVSTCSCA